MGKKFLICAISGLLSIGLALAQSTVSGVVTSSEDGFPVIGASVFVQGTSNGVVTDVNGSYTLSDVPAEAMIVFSYIGMKDVVRQAAATLNVILYPDTELLNEVVVTAMGITRSEKSLGYSATTVRNEEIAAQRSTNVTSALAGKVAGVQVQAATADPGATNSIVIRGYGSISGSNQPLYIVDGIPLSTVSSTTQGHGIALGGISSIAPDDIESMTILKGAAATALYGSRASNGVIVVTTKSGKGSSMRNFTIEYNGGVQARQVDILPTFQNEYGQGWNGQQTFIENGSWGPKFDGSRQVYGPIWNHQQLIHDYKAVTNNVRDFFDIGLSQNHSIAVSGVSEDQKSTYYISYAHTADDGIIPTNADSYSRNTISMRNSFAPTKWLKLSSQMNLALSKTDVVGSFQGTSVIDGIYELPRDISIVDMKDISNPFFTPEAYLTPYGITNPYWSLANNYNHTDQKQVFGKVQADVKPVKPVTLTYRFAFDYSDYDRKIGRPEIALDDALIDDDMGYAPSSMNENGYVSASYYRRYEINHDFLATYADTFVDDRLDVNVIAGLNINERYSTSMSGSADVLTFESGFWDLSNGATWTGLSEGQSKRRLIGLFGDVTLGWDDTFFLNATIRNDWSSTLPIPNNHYLYPGVTASWVFTNMLPKNRVLTFGKLRLAYGKTGNDASTYRTNPVYNQAGYSGGYYGSSSASFPMNGINAFARTTTISSTTLRPEMTSEFEVGTNLQFFNGRIGIDAAYYNKLTSDQIFNVSIDAAVGYTSATMNFGDVRNQGLELLLTTTPVQTRDFRWDLDINFSKNYNEVVSLPEGLEGKTAINGYSAGNDNVTMYAEVGKPIGTYWTYVPKTVEDVNSPYYGYLIVDRAGQPTQTSDLTPTGLDMNHKWIGGLSTSISWKGLTLSAALDVRYGGTMFSRTKNLMQFTGNGIITTYNDRRPFVIPHSVVANADGSYSENTTPILLMDSSMQDYYNEHGYGNAGLALLMDRSYAKLRNVSLSYELPRKWIGPFRAIALSVFINNAFTWTAKDNYYVDPESSTYGSDLYGSFGESYTNPSCRLYGCNLNIKF